MRAIFRSIIITLLVLYPQQYLIAQSTDFGNWFVYFGNQKINKQLNWYNEVQHRNYNLLGDLQQLILRTGMGTNLTPNNNNVLLGYGYILSQNYLGANPGNVPSSEHRIYQQYIYKNRIGRSYLLHRFRLEERFLFNAYATRFRYFLNVNIPLNKDKMIANTVYLSIYDELFLHVNQSVFDRNRLYGALGYVISDYVKIEIGAMNQLTKTQQRNQLQIVVYNNIPLTNQ